MNRTLSDGRTAVNKEKRSRMDRAVIQTDSEKTQEKECKNEYISAY